jgi:DNA-binding Xre family transcriptional regulator
MEDPREHGPQPLDELMAKWKLTNHQLVETSTEQLNHKQVQKARKGRQLTLPMMQKICRALNITIWHRLDKAQKETYFEYMHRHLFSYAKGHEADWEDPNTVMYPGE